MVMTSCRDLDSTRSALSATSAFAIATAGANEGTPTKEKYRRMSLASAGTRPEGLLGVPCWESPQSSRVLGSGHGPALGMCRWYRCVTASWHRAQGCWGRALAALQPCEPFLRG